MEKIMNVSNLKKSYGNIQAVKDISFYVEAGSFFSFLGENGAGKSTTIDILTTLLKPDAGEITINGMILGKNDEGIRNIIGAVFQENMLDNDLTVKENLECRGGLYALGEKNMAEAIAYVTKVTGIDDVLNRRYGRLSGGQRRRADIARALMTRPKILFLDEPTTGLDPKSRESVWQSIENIRKETNMTVFLTTHYMEEAADSDYVVVMGQGEILAKGSPGALKTLYAGDRVKMAARNVDTLKAALASKGIACRVRNHMVEVTVSHTLEGLDLACEFRDLLEHVEILPGSIEQAFIHITGAGKKEMGS